jgi:transcriptional regulator with XRE-family HTH domain
MEPMEMTKIILRKNLKELREERGWNQEELGEATGYTRGFIADIERGKSWVSPEALEKLAEAFNVPLERLFSSGAGPKTKPFAETLPVPRLLELLNKKVAGVDGRIFDLSQRLSPDNNVWDIVVGILETAAHQEELDHYKKLAGRKD